jgi:gamma-butyrobetaine dioxygenase
MPCHTPEVEIGDDDETLVVVWQDGHASSYGWLWLRDCCGCEQCRGDGTTQRLADVASLPAAPRPASVACRGEDLVVSWSPDGHESRHELARLRARCACCEHAWASTEPRDRWNAATEGIPARRTLEELRADESALEAWLAAVAESGIAVLGGVGTSEGSLNGVVELFGFIRETNYGRIFDVVTTVDPRNLAFTSLPLGPHTDNPYREPPPTLQLLHCLASSPAGGESVFVDGLEAAKRLAEEDPDAFARLSGLAVQWRYADESTELTCRAPVLDVDAGGSLVSVRFNERARVPSTFTAELADGHLRALRAFAEILDRRELQKRFSLEPGELVCFDNLRVLHGRTGFESGGERHLQGCYADRDGLASRLAVLRRRQEGAIRRVAADRGA